jgi:hypothetical protein
MFMSKLEMGGVSGLPYGETTLTVPWVRIEKQNVQKNYEGESPYIVSGHCPRWHVWLLLRNFEKKEEAVAYILEQLKAESVGPIENPKEIVFSASQSSRIRHYGPLPQSMEEYIDKGVSPLALGSAFLPSATPERMKQGIGVWRPVSPAVADDFYQFLNT